jgi:hypothetical protein
MHCPVRVQAWGLEKGLEKGLGAQGSQVTTMRRNMDSLRNLATTGLILTGGNYDYRVVRIEYN